MIIFKSINKLNKEVNFKADVGFVPTMGALHKGHISLIKSSKKLCKKTLVSIFINPTQFNKKNDYNKYPKNIKKDIKILKKLKVDYLLTPNVSEIYKDKKSKKIYIKKKDKVMCALYRPGHFEGVLAVINQFLMKFKPKHIFFGEKDFQQLKIVEKLIIQNKLKANLVKCSSIRGLNGMSLSSRYTKLSSKEKTQFDECAKIIDKNLLDLINSFDTKILENIKKELQSIGISKIDYCEVREERNLEISKTNLHSRLFLAFYVNKIRIIDNFVLY